MSFDEQDSLATCLAKAKDGYSSDSDTTTLGAANNQNTHIWVQYDNGGEAENVTIEKVLPQRALKSHWKE